MATLEQLEARLDKVEIAALDWMETKNKIKWVIAAVVGAGTAGGTGISTWLAWLKGWLE